ncbi:MAG: hypothetical protein A2Y42_00425 [Omnitrophica WOR_2 bacterium GWB2_45_9]|nr:MAG: hypothetical protein A2Y42_00425 [Omnitrophica WOR_2 bacterium GWB2_45_9]OGX60317.1 MAG: hypothetical protein A2471_01530 [Omnitrophica WOR_2 bacterium RIFOXYC2_FULL_45_15]HBU08280.1 GxxExxY protein [Candidatus Omnitrophota bacterium]
MEELIVSAEAQREIKLKTREDLNKLTDKIIGIAIEVHKAIGPGFVERIYDQALRQEFINCKINFESQKQIKVNYKDVELGLQQIDFLIEGELILEIKAVSRINSAHAAQLISYLKTIKVRVGLILNFSRDKLEIKRVVNKF